MNRWLMALAFAMAAWSGASFGQQGEDAVRLQIAVMPELARHLEFLAAPGYIALALENNGLYPSLSSRLILKDRESFQVRKGVVRFKGKKGALYLYEAGVNVQLGVVEQALTVPVEVDTESISKGTLMVRAYPPLKNLLPNDLTQRAEIKVAAILNTAAQQKLLAYLDRLTDEQRARGRGFDGVLEAIVLEAYNNSGSPGPGRDRGDAEPLSDQVLLLATAATWLIGLPAFLLYLRARRKRVRAPTA